MNKEWLETFLSVARTKSVSNASELLFVSQSTISHRVQALERTLNQRLFVQRNRQMMLTEAGQTFVPFATDIIDSWNRCLARMRGHADQERDELRIGIHPALASSCNTTWLTFAKQHPSIRCSIQTVPSEQALSLLLHHTVHGIWTPEPLQHARVSSQEQQRSPYAILTLPDHPLVQSHSVSMRDLRQEPWAYWLPACAGQRVHPVPAALLSASNCRMQTDNLDLCKQFVRNRLGVAYVPAGLVQTDIDYGCFASSVPDLPSAPQCPVYLAWLTEHTHPNTLHLLLDFFSVQTSIPVQSCTYG